MLLQAAANFAQRHALTSHPVEDLLDNACFLKKHLITCSASAIGFADIAIAERRAGKSVDTTLACGMQLAPATPLQKFGSLLFRYHALDL